MGPFWIVIPMNEQLTQIYGYLHGMWRFRWSALIVTWLTAILGWIVVFSLPDEYTVRSVVYVDTSSVLRPLLEGLAPELEAQDELAVISRVLLSRENLLSVMRETDMDLKVHKIEDREDLLEELKKAIKIKVVSGGRQRSAQNNIFELEYASNSRQQAYQVVSSLVNTMIEESLSSTRTDTQTAENFLDSQISEYEKRLSAAEQRLAEFKKENVGYMPDEKGSYYDRLQHAQEAVAALRSELKLAERRYSELMKQLSGEKPLINNQVYESNRASKIRQLEDQLKQLLHAYTSKHPDVQALRATIEDLKSGKTAVEGLGEGDMVEFNPVYQEMKVEANKASVELELLRIELKDQQEYVDRLKNSIDIIPEVEANLTRLNRDYEITRSRYLDLVERRESARLAQNAEKKTSDVKFRVIEPPVVPVLPSGPPRLILIAGVLIVSFGMGAGWSFGRFMLEPTFFDLQQVSEKTGKPLLGSVSLYISPEHRQRRKRQLKTFLLMVFLLLIMFVLSMIFADEISDFVTGIYSDLDKVLTEDQ